MTRLWIPFMAVCLACLFGLGAMAQTPQPMTTTPQVQLQEQPQEAVPEALAAQRQVLVQQRQAIMAEYEKQQAACWQKFAVNACLIEARRVRRQGLAPINQQELILNAQERDWRTEQRERRLQDKQTDAKDRP